MSNFQGVDEGPLAIKREDTKDSIRLLFVGKSILRDPAEFLQPILLEVLAEADADDRRMILDFSQLTYMNSSTFTPVVKTLERARLGTSKVSIVYDANAKWQKVSFAALAIFVSGDGRVDIQAVA